MEKYGHADVVNEINSNTLSMPSRYGFLISNWRWMCAFHDEMWNATASSYKPFPTFLASLLVCMPDLVRFWTNLKWFGQKKGKLRSESVHIKIVHGSSYACIAKNGSEVQFAYSVFRYIKRKMCFSRSSRSMNTDSVSSVFLLKKKTIFWGY